MKQLMSCFKILSTLSLILFCEEEERRRGRGEEGGGGGGEGGEGKGGGGEGGEGKRGETALLCVCRALWRRWCHLSMDECHSYLFSNLQLGHFGS